MVEQKKVRLDEPVRALLPAGTVAAPASGAEITLLDLSAQRSGLPRMPDNFKPGDPNNPYADYDKNALYAFVASHGVALPAKPEFGYSNLGVGLLGQALAERAGTTYEALLHKQVTGPLGMRDTVITLPRPPCARASSPVTTASTSPRTRGTRTRSRRRSHPVDGGRHAHLPRGPAPPRPPAAGDRARRRRARRSRRPSPLRTCSQGEGGAAAGMHIALNWLRVDETGSFWHNGGHGRLQRVRGLQPREGLRRHRPVQHEPGRPQLRRRPRRARRAAPHRETRGVTRTARGGSAIAPSTLDEAPRDRAIPTAASRGTRGRSSSRPA